MADQPNERDRLDETIGDETDEQKRQRKQQGSARPNTQSEPTDTLEDRNLSGSSTWATLPEQNTTEEEDEGQSDGESRNR